MRIQFQGHWGDLDPLTNECAFYGAHFRDMCVAAEHLKGVPAGPSYIAKAFGRHIVFQIKAYEPDEYTMEVRRVSQWASVPRRASEGAAGYDLYSAETLVIAPGTRALVATGIAIKMPPGLYGRVAPRSGLAVKHGIQIGAGVIDIDYQGEIKVLVFNHGDEPFQVSTGDRIAQLILERHETPIIHEVLELSGSATDRGASGFGSTGLS